MADWWVGLEEGLRWSAHPLSGAVCRGHGQFLAFAPSSSGMAVGLWPFCILLFTIAGTAHACSYF